MEKLLITVLLIVLFAIPIQCMAENNTNETLRFIDSDLLITEFDTSACTSVDFYAEGGTLLTISWNDGIIDIKYGENVTKTKAASIFFDFLKQYIEEGYRIIPKERK